MPARNRAHYRGSYKREAQQLRAAAYANPDTRCGRCGLTLEEHAPHRNGKPATWDAGHVLDATPGAPLQPEASTCNRSAGTIKSNQTRARTTTTRPW